MELKNYYSYKEFLNEKKNTDSLNEGLWDFFKGLFKKVAALAKKVKESKEIDKIIDAAKKEITATGEKKIAELINSSQQSGTTQNTQAQTNTQTQTNTQAKTPAKAGTQPAKAGTQPAKAGTQPAKAGTQPKTATPPTT